MEKRHLKEDLFNLNRKIVLALRVLHILIDVSFITSFIATAQF